MIDDGPGLILATPDVHVFFERMRNLRVLVVGDVMIDEWVWGQVTRISPEAPVPVVTVTDHSFTLGGSGNVAGNLRALGIGVGFSAAVGNDNEGRRVRELLDALEVNRAGLVMVDDRPTIRKTRVVAHNQQVVRADWESDEPFSDKDHALMRAAVAREAAKYDAVILSDYAKGLFSREIVEASLACPIVTADPKPANIDLFHGVTCVAPNVHEASGATGIRITDDASLERAGMKLLEQLACRYVLITRGEKGMALFGADGERVFVPAVARTVFDVSGAGDTVIATFTAALAAQAPVELAVQLANFAAGVVVEKLGTAVASPDEIIALVEHGGR